MKKFMLTLCVACGLAFGSDTNRVVELSRLDWARVQSGMNASNRWTFVEQKVMLVITNKVEEPLPMTLPPLRPIGRGPDLNRKERSLLLEPQDYLK